MTAYFDDLNREIRELPSDDLWIAKLSLIENKVVQEIKLVIDYQEFPVDLREKIFSVMENTVYLSSEAREDALASRHSDLIESLHSSFHELARRRIKTRFGLMLDSPRGILILKEEFEKEIKEC